MGHPLANELSAALKQMGLNEIDEAKQTQLLAFVDLMMKWNRVYNLTAVRSPTEMLRRHILDSLSVLPYLPTGSLLDIGTGAGLPGIPLAIVQPQRSFTLLDSAAKRIRFVQQAVAELGLINVEVKQYRIEDYINRYTQASDAPKFDVVISRAFTAVEKFLPICKPLLAGNGWCLAMVGIQKSDWLVPEHWQPQGYTNVKSTELYIPNESAERHLLSLQLTVDRTP